MSVIDSPALLNTFLEGLGIEPDQIDKQPFLELLHSDLSHKLQEILQEAKKIMRHSKRDFLTSQDIKFAMSKLNLDQVFGYPSYAQQYTYEKMNQGQSNLGAEADNEMTAHTNQLADQVNLWYTKPTQIDLKDYVTNPKMSSKGYKDVPRPMTYHMHFTAINGIQPNIAENIEEIVKEPSAINEEIKTVAMTGKDIVNIQKAHVEGAQKSNEHLKQYNNSQTTQSIQNPMHLTKELDAFYHIFIDRFQKIEKELRINQISDGAVIQFMKSKDVSFISQKKFGIEISQKRDGAQMPMNLAHCHEQFGLILAQLRSQPALKDLFVHIIHFIQGKNLVLLQSRPECDSLSFYLILQSLESLISNQFYDIEIRIHEIMSVLMSITLQQNYHSKTTEGSIIALKQKNAQIIGQILNSNRTDLKHDFANILLKNTFEAAKDSQQYKLFGCVCGLTQFGPVMTAKAILPNFDQIMEGIDTVDQVTKLNISGSTVILEMKQLLHTTLQDLIAHIKIYKKAEDARNQIEMINELVQKYFN